MNDLLAYISTWSVLKWVALVLIAGFIGQFGRMAAEAIAKKIRTGRTLQEKKEIKPETPLPPPTPQAHRSPCPRQPRPRASPARTGR